LERNLINSDELSFEEMNQKFGPAKILIVDDNSKNIQVIGHLLKNVDWCSLSATLDSEKAIELASKTHPEIILLDLHMPKLNGLEVLNELKKLKILEFTTVLFLTADKEIGNRIEGLTLGCADYIQKPFNPEELIIKLKYHIKMRLYEKEILNSLKNTKNILDNMNQAIFSIDKNGNIVEPISKRSFEILGSIVSPGKNIKDFFSNNFLLSSKEIETTLKNISNSFNESKIYWNEIKKKLPNKVTLKKDRNNESTLKIRYSSVWNNENLERIIFYFFDITTKEEKADELTKYSLSQIASLTDINLETLRSWTKRFHIKGNFFDTEKKYRYSGKELKIFQLYKSLIHKGENIGSLVKLNYNELKNRELFLSDNKKEKDPSQNKAFNFSEMVNTLHFFLAKKELDIFSRNFDRLNGLCNKRQLVFDIILPFLKLMDKEKSWDKFSDSKIKFLNHFLSKKIIEFGLTSKTSQKHFNHHLYFFDIFHKGHSLSCPLASLLASHHNIESYYIREDIFEPSIYEMISEDEFSLIILCLDKKGPFDESEFKIIKNDILNSNLLKRKNIFLLNNHPTIKEAHSKETSFEVLHSFEELDKIFIDFSTQLKLVKSAA